MTKEARFPELEFEIDTEQILLHSRNVLLHGEVSAQSSKEICEKLLVLDYVEKNPIGLWVNCTGGSIGCGFSIIDTIMGLKSPVYTFICGYSSSMGSLIALAGDRRMMTENSIWMFHDLTAFINNGEEYGDKLIARCEDYYKLLQLRIEKYLKKRTRLTERDLHKARTKELWLFPEECKRKGIVDVVAKRRIKR